MDLNETSTNVITPGIESWQGDLPAQKKPAGFHGPVSGEMWNTVVRLKSAYPDTFDYSIYDKILEVYKGEAPRGGVTFKSWATLKNFHSSIA